MCKLLKNADEVTIVVRVAVVTVKVVVADTDVSAGSAVTQGDAAYTAAETLDVVEQPQTFNNHCSASSYDAQLKQNLVIGII